MTPDFDLLVVGGGPAALSAARGYRNAGGAGAVAMIADEERMPYNRPPLTKEFLRGTMGEDELPLEPEGWLDEQSVRLVSGRAVALDHAAKVVTLSGGRELTYGSVVLATGAEPARLPVPGSDHPAVLVIRTLDEVRKLKRRLAGGAKVIVIGSGFIGCEIAASLRYRGLSVTLISNEQAPNVARLGPEAASEIAHWLEESGVKLSLGVAVDSIDQRAGQIQVRAGHVTEVGRVVVMAAGVRPRSELVVPSGTPLEDGAIPVGAGMQTALPGVLAAGDVCKAHNVTAGRRLRVEHWGDAMSQGEIAGATAAGKEAEWGGVPGFWSTIGRHTLKYAAWGDGYDSCSFERYDGDGDGWAVWYGRAGRLVGVLTHEADEQYERGSELISSSSTVTRSGASVS